MTGEGTFNTTSPRKGLQWTARIDHHLNDSKDRIYGAINRTTVDKVLFGTPDVYPDFNTISPTNSLHFNTNWTRIVSPHMVNEASFSYVHVYGNLPLNRPDVPGIQVTGIERYQTTWGPNDFVQNNFEWRDVLSWTRSAHSLKIGGGFTAEHADNEGSRVFNRPIYTFPSVFDFAADQPSRQDNLAIDPNTGGAVTNLLREHRTNSISAFLQDDWKVRPNLTLSLGLRYEGYSNIRDAAGDVTAIEFASRSGIAPAGSRDRHARRTAIHAGWRALERACTRSRRARASRGIRRRKGACPCEPASAGSTSACPTSSGTRSTRTCPGSP